MGSGFGRSLGSAGIREGRFGFGMDGIWGWFGVRGRGFGRLGGMTHDFGGRIWVME